MSKATKIWLAIAASLVLIGCIIFAGLMTQLRWDFTKLSTVKYETNTYQASDVFRNISLKTDTADILFAPSEDGTCRVVCYEQENAKHSVAVQNGTLSIHVVNQKEWYDYIGITPGTPKITVYLPDAEYETLFIKESTGDIKIPKEFKFERIDVSTNTGDVENYASASEGIKIKTSTGHIRLENISADTIELSVSTGRTNISDTQCKNVISSGNTGDITLKNVIAAEAFSIERSTGDVEFDGCDAAGIFVKTDTGDVTGSFLTDKIFMTETDTGSIDVPGTMAGGKCEITTDTGDISIKIQQ